MNWVRSAVQVYRDINPSTLSGAIDVIVVERPAAGSSPADAITTATEDTEMACSPFHVRFGKLSVLRPVDKKVRITVNDEAVPFFMKVGETGEAFFVFETDADVPEELQTSPLAGPVGDDDVEGEDGGMEPEFLDLNGAADGGGPPLATPDIAEADADPNLSPRSSPPSSPTSSRYASFSQTAINSPTATIRSLPSNGFLPAFSGLSLTPSQKGKARATDSDPPAEADTDKAASGGAGAGAGADTEETSARRAPPVNSRRQPAARDEGKPPKDFPVRGALAAAAQNVVAGGGAALATLASPLTLADELLHRRGASAEEPGAGEEEDGKGEGDGEGEEGVQARDGTKELGVSEQAKEEQYEDPGDDVRRSARKREAKMATNSPAMERTESALALPPHAETTADLVLDMEGYKMEGAPEADGVAVDEAGLADGGEQLTGAGPSVLGLGLQGDLDEAAAANLIAFAQGLLQASDPEILQRFMNPTADSSDAQTDHSRSRASSPVPSFLLDDEEALASLATLSNFSSASSLRASSPTPSARTTRASSPHRSISISSLQGVQAGAPEEGDGISPVPGQEGRFVLRSAGRVHRFEMSLCGEGGAFGVDRTLDDTAFVKHQVTFAQFVDADSEGLAEDPDLIVKYENRYLSWDTAAPILASLAVYRRSLVEHPEHIRPASSADDDAKPAKQGWGAWWRSGRSGRSASTSAVGVETGSLPPLGDGGVPSLSPPASPRSLSALDIPSRIDPDLIPSKATPIEDTDLDVVPMDPKKHYAKTLRLTSDQLKSLNLKKGMNTISFSVRSSYSGYATCTSRIFLWDSDFHVVISDIDGTITKSDALGHVFTMIGRDWTHLGVAKLYTDIARNGYKMMYLTSRAIGQADTTREYLKGIKQNGFTLPEGPVIMSPDRLMTSLHREVIMRKPEVFKMACLKDIARLFGERSPFYAGFGNRITDALSYRSVEIPSSRIFTIDTNGEVKMELLDLAGYKSSYIHMTDLVDQMFPPVHRAAAPAFTDFNFWRAPMPAFEFDLPELEPVSPALSARSDAQVAGAGGAAGAGVGRPRFPGRGLASSLASTLSRRSSRATLAEAPAGHSSRAGTPVSPPLRATLSAESVAEGGRGEEEGQAEGGGEGDFDDGRSESEGMPGSLPDDGDFERLRREAERRRWEGGAGRTRAQDYVEEVRGVGRGDGEETDEEDEEEEEEEEEEEGNEPDDLDLDFSSVPYL